MLIWIVINGKPRLGFLFSRMQKTTATFKLALRYCRQNEQQLRADACASSLSSKDPTKFWESIKKVSNSKATKYASTIGCVSGEEQITETWKNHFQQEYNSVKCDNDAKLVTNLLATANGGDVTVCLADVVDAIRKQKKGKSAWPDGVHSKVFIHGGLRLAAHLGILFNLFLVHSFVPDIFMRCTIVPLVKCKAADLTDINNYRAVTLPNSVTKILEVILLSYVNDKIGIVEYQFGLKKWTFYLIMHSFL